MKTPVQQIYDHVRATKEGRGYGAEYCIDWLLEFESKMLEKEKKIMCDFAYNCRNVMAADGFAITHWYDKTFNTKEK